ncbi:hypothetical protein GCM10027168_02710 [Streptomyces capparidis]
MARVGAASVWSSLRDVHTELYQDEDVEDTLHRIPMPTTGRGRVELLAKDYASPADTRPPAGVPRAAAQWWQNVQHARDTLFADAEHALRPHVPGLKVVGALGDGRSRLAQVQRCREEKRSFLSLSISGSLRNFLVTGAGDTLAVSILVWLPGGPLAAAVVTANSALAADCGSAYRLRPAYAEWERITEDTSRQPADTGHVVLPVEMRSSDAWLRGVFHDIHYSRLTSATITDALLSHSVPVAVSSSSAPLDSALPLVAAAHGFTVRPLAPERSPAWAPWEAAARVLRALTEGTPLPELIISRDQLTAGSLARVLQLRP